MLVASKSQAGKRILGARERGEAEEKDSTCFDTDETPLSTLPRTTPYGGTGFDLK